MIGIFDSGIGGLTVMKEFLKRFPDFNYLYLGDQANVPYGSRSPELINKLVEKNVAWMIRQGCKLIIIACNTASAEALRHVQNIYKGKPVILGVLVPAVEEALRQTRFGNIGVIGTRGTIASGAYEREIKKRSAPVGRDARSRVSTTGVRVFAKACPLLVPLIEEGWAGKPETNMILKKYLRPLKNCHVDTLILGCTHYPLLAKDIKRIMGKNVRLVDCGEAAASAMGSYFDRHPDVLKAVTPPCIPPLCKGGKLPFIPPLCKGGKLPFIPPLCKGGKLQGGSLTFFTTDNPERFSELGSKFLGKKIKAEKVEF